MAKIKINDKHEIEGKVTLINECDSSQIPAVISHYGLLTTGKYIEDIKMIKTNKFILDGVDVFFESLGSDDDEILYKFTTRDVDINKDIILE